MKTYKIIIWNLLIVSVFCSGSIFLAISKWLLPIGLLNILVGFILLHFYLEEL